MYSKLLVAAAVAHSNAGTKDPEREAPPKQEVTYKMTKSDEKRT